jgi:general L-amino acid transport system permease protein
MAALGAGVIAAIAVSGWARRRQDRTGSAFPAGWIGLALVLLPPILVFVVAGAPVALDEPHLVGFNFRGGITLTPEFVALELGLVLYTAAFIGEVVRGGILGVGRGQGEAAQALGLHRGQILRLVVLPQALRIILPPLTNEYLNLAKNSSLAVAIGFFDFMSIANTITNQTGHAIEVMAIVAAVYLTLSLGISLAMNLYNRRMAPVDR